MKNKASLVLMSVLGLFLGSEITSANDLQLVLRRRVEGQNPENLKDFDAGKVTGFRIVTGRAFDIVEEPRLGSFSLEQIAKIEMRVPYFSDAETFLELTAEKGICYLSSFDKGGLSLNQQLVMDLVLSSKSAKIVCLTDNALRVDPANGPIVDSHEATGLIVEGRP